MIDGAETVRLGLRGAFLLERFMWLGFAPDVQLCLQALRAVIPEDSLADVRVQLRTRKRKLVERPEAAKKVITTDAEELGEEEGVPDNKMLLQLIARAEVAQRAVLWGPLLTAFDLAQKNLALLPDGGAFANHSVSSADLSPGGELSARWFMTDPANGGMFGRILVRTLSLPHQQILQTLRDWPTSTWRTAQSQGGLVHLEGVIGPADVRILGLISGVAEITVRAGTAHEAVDVFNRVVNRASEGLPRLAAGGLVDVLMTYLSS